MLYKFKLDHNAMEASKNICCVKDEGVIDYNTDGSKNFVQVARTSMIR